MSFVWAPPAGSAELPAFWNLDRLTSTGAAQVDLTDSGGQAIGTLTHTRLTTIAAVRRSLESASGRQVDLYLVSDARPYALSTRMSNGRNLVCLTLPMLAALNDDPDEIAAVVAHEFAHLVLDHEAARLHEARELSRTSQTVFDVIALLALFGRFGPTPPAADVGQSSWALVREGMSQGARIGAAVGIAGGVAVHGALGELSLGQERDADRLGLQFVTLAGFDSRAVVRMLGRASSDSADWHVQNMAHPVDPQRIEAASAMAITLAPNRTQGAERLINEREAARPHRERAMVAGESRPVTYDSEPRSPTVFEQIDCRMPDGTGMRVARIECLRREGHPAVR